MTKKEEQPLLYEESALEDQDQASNVPVEDLISARICFFVWTFIGNASWGVVVVLYTNFFYDVIDNENYSNASLYSTISLSIYAVISFICSPIVATLSDSIGRKPVIVMSAFTDAYTTIISGLIPSNSVYIAMMGLQGAGDTSQAVGLSLLADCIIGTPKGFYGSEKDIWLSRLIYSLLSLNTKKSGDDDDDYVQDELKNQFTIVLILQTWGLVSGLGFGSLMFKLTRSYQWSIASGGLLCIPCMFYLMVVMPESLSFQQRKPFQLHSVIDSITSQTSTVHIFLSNPRLMGLSFVNFLVQFVSAGIIGVILYWGEWKFGWDPSSESFVQFVVISAGLIGALLIASLSQNYTQLCVANVISGSCFVSAFSCVPIGLLSKNSFVLIGCFFMGLGFGNAPALFSQISAEVPRALQGRAQGFNYAVMTVAWASGPLVYWAMFSGRVSDDSAQTHTHNTTASLFWWVSFALLFAAGVVMKRLVGDLVNSKLVFVS
mmetsp:Transcript_15218/g.19745  ORF Transcript_15218/g.19745 Transcript_15218/m.19745 type:complete len:490 (-) Transcript_15218:183-1652(-)